MRDYFEADETHDITATVKALTGKAVLVSVDNGDEVWLPLSQITMSKDVPEKGDEVEITMPAWLAREKDFL